MSSRQKPRLSFESLEIRTQLSSIHAVEAHHHGGDSHRPAIVGHGHGHGSDHQNSVTNLRATLSDPAGTSDVSGNAQVQIRTHHGVTTTSLRVGVQGATEGDVIDVSVDGTSAGQITVGEDGTGSLKLKSGAPTAAVGSEITLSTTTTDETGAEVTTVLATGTLAKVGKPGNTAHQSVHLHATATDETSGVSVRSVFQSESQNGHTENNLVIKVKGATAGDQLDISLTDSTGTSVSLGTATVNRGGVAHLHLHNTSAIAAGDTLTVSTVADDGTLTEITTATFATKK